MVFVARLPSSSGFKNEKKEEGRKEMKWKDMKISRSFNPLQRLGHLSPEFQLEFDSQI